MRSSFFWEAAMISLLIIVGVGAISAWSITRQRSRRPQPSVEQPATDVVMVKAVESVRLYAPFALRINGPIFIDEGTVEKTLVVTKDAKSEWNVTGAASGDSIDAANFRWIVHVIDAQGKVTVKQVKCNGEVIFTHEDDAENEAAIALKPAA